jgi:hypothetical protein
MKKLAAMLILIILLPALNGFAQAKPTELSLWTFQELHAQFY